MLVVVTLIPIMFGALGISSYLKSGWAWPTLGFASFSALGLVAIAEQTTARIVISREGIKTHSLWSRRLYSVGEVVWVAPNGGFLLVGLANGKWEKIPGLGQDPAHIAEVARELLRLPAEE